MGWDSDHFGYSFAIRALWRTWTETWLATIAELEGRSLGRLRAKLARAVADRRVLGLDGPDDPIELVRWRACEDLARELP